jgi:hypothetical protein
VRENGRITLMFCAFDGAPDVVRLHGHGRVVTVYDDEYADWAGRFSETRGARAVILIDVERVSDSCGHAVPLMEYVVQRDLLPARMDRKGAAGIVKYRRLKNRTSIDGLPAYAYDPG